MNLTKEKLVALWNKREEIFAENENLIKRFDKVDELFNEFQIIEVEIDAAQKKVVVKKANEKENDLEIQGIDCSYFGITKDERQFCLDRTKGQEPVNLMATLLSSDRIYWKNLIQDIGCLLSGYDFSSTLLDRYKMMEEYRLLSNNKVAHDDNGSLLTGGQYQAASSQLSGNNYFFWVLKTIAEIRTGSFAPQDSRLVLSYPNSKALDNEEKQRAILERRFPYKFFYMWTHKDEVIHPFSLKAYKNFITQKDAPLQYNADQAMNQTYADFVKNWKTYSDGIVKIIADSDSSASLNPATIADLSKLISIIMTKESDIKNIRDLIETGNKAIILWGPPGTGKTYQAMALVREMLSIPEKETKEKNEQELIKYQFPKVGHWGSYDIVQFHPNYTYEDFVGGISPKLDGGNLGYMLKTGRFKAFCDAASEPNNSKKKFIFIIDEINRADLSAVFGELLYALEYRDSPIAIPNFPDSFKIPSNVYIVGTMNNVDKSLVSFDLALRRRFGFFKVMPKMKVLENLSQYIDEDFLSAYIKRCEKLNESISDKNGLGLGEDYQIGQAYFLKIKDFLPKKELSSGEAGECLPKEELQSGGVKEGLPEEELQSDESEESFALSNLTIFELEKLWVYHIEPLLEEYLGNKIDDENTKKKIVSLRKAFTEELKA